MDLVFDFRKKATRSHILNTLHAAMDTTQLQRFNDMLEHASIPDVQHHGIADINSTIDALDMPDQVKNDMRAVYAILVAAEAKVHGVSVQEAHFHEVGNASGVRNALAICIAFYVLAPSAVKASPVQQGSGTIMCAHGQMDVPTPATQAIIDTGIPVYEKRLKGELITPTSAALIKHFVQEFTA